MTLKAIISALVVLVMLAVAVMLAAKGQPLDLGWGGLFAVVFGSALGVNEAQAKKAARVVQDALTSDSSAPPEEAANE